MANDLPFGAAPGSGMVRPGPAPNLDGRRAAAPPPGRASSSLPPSPGPKGAGG